MSALVNDLVSRLQKVTGPSGGWWKARCPFPGHDDDHPSFGFTSEGFNCQGCGKKGHITELARHLGIQLQSDNGASTVLATYPYQDESGAVLYEVVRFFPKDFRQRVRQGDGWLWRLKGVRRVLYRLPELLAGMEGGRWVLIVEGEKDADELARNGFVATTCSGGAGRWLDEYSKIMDGARVCILPDNDEQGRTHAQDVAQSLHGVAAEVRVLELPDLPQKGDVSDYLDAGGTTDELKVLVRTAPVWHPLVEADHDPQTVGRVTPVHRTDLGNAQRLVRLFGDRIRYVHAWGRWLVWDGKRWAQNDRGQVQGFAKKTVMAMHEEALKRPDGRDARKALSTWAFGSESEGRLKAMVSLTQTEPEIPLVPDELDSDPWAFNVLNGTIDLQTGDLFEHDQGDQITKLAPVEYDPSAIAPTWDRFLLEIMADRPDLVSFLQRLIGYSLTGLTTEHVLLFLYGLGANGKTTFLNTVLTLAGDYGRQSEPELLIRKRRDSHPTGVADLKGARVVVTSEIDAGRSLAESLLKQLTGGDRIVARFMKRDFFEFEPSHTLWLAANYRPVVKGTDTAIWRRIHLIPFDVTFPPDRQDPDLTKKLRAELPGILNWAVRGCLEWQREGLNPPAEVRAATDGYRDDMDVLGGFISEHCAVEEGAEAEARDLYKEYTVWAEAGGEKKLAKNVFGRQLQERGFESFKHAKHRRVVYRGIGLGKPSEATRSNVHVDALETGHVGTNAEVASGTFATADDDDYERIEREAIQAEGAV